jgi:TonB family protein
MSHRLFWAFTATLLSLSTTLSAVVRADDASPPVAATSPPRLVKPAPANYPAGATDRAFVILRVVVSADGSVSQASVLAGPEPFASAAMAALKGARFAPAMRGSQPVSATIRFRVDFEPPAPATPSAAPPTATPPATTREPLPIEAATVEVTVHGSRPAAPGSEALGRAEIRQLPGAFGDPFRAVEVLPGVTPIVSGLPYYYVRGSPPGDVGYFIDGIRVPYLFHFLLGPAVIHPSLVEKIELYPGGYPAELGHYAGAIVATDLRAPTSGVHGEANIRIVDSGALVEAPFADGRGSAIVAGRVSYTAALVSLLAENVSLAYRDYQAEVSYKVDRDNTLSLFTFGAFDLAGDVQNGAKETLFASEFYRVDLRYDHASAGGASARIATAFGLDRTRLAGTRFATDVLIQPRATLRIPLSENILLRGGFDATLDVMHGDPPSPYSESDAQLSADTALLATRLDYVVGAHGDIVANVTRAFQVTPGLRVDLYGSGGDRAVAVEPRLACRLALTDRIRLVEAYGLAHQPPALPVPVPALAIAHLAGGLQSTIQTSGGVEVDLPFATTASATLFHNAFFNMSDALGASNTKQPQDDVFLGRTRTSTDGSAYGVELSARRSLSQRVGGLISYTLSRSERTTDQIRPSGFDRTHVVNVALSADLGKGWRGGARLLAYSGIPTRSPSTLAAIAAGASGLADRTPAYYRLDLRLEKKWLVGQAGTVSFVAEMLNATANKEVLDYTCGNFATTGPPPAPGTQPSAPTCRPDPIGPIAIPSLGLEGGF